MTIVEPDKVGWASKKDDSGQFFSMVMDRVLRINPEPIGKTISVSC